MPLTQDDIKKLRRPFAPEDHEFYNGYAYVAELAVCMRLEEVDPSYEFRLSSNPEPRTFVAEFVQVWQKATMTVNGVTRENTGMSKVESTKKGDREAGEPEKSSATDSLRRCARLFGVGQYLLNCPGWVQDIETMREWLESGMQQQRRKRPQNAAASPQKRETTPNKSNTHNGATNGQNGANQSKTIDGTIDHVLLKEVRVYVKEPETKHRYEFATEDGRKVYEFSRDKFKELGWIEDHEWQDIGTYTIKHLIPAAVKFNATDTGGWWNIDTIAEVEF